MDRIYSEGDITWSSIEKDISYSKVVWSIQDNGIPIYALLDGEGEKIGINSENENY